MGPSYASKRQEAVATMMEYAAVLEGVVVSPGTHHVTQISFIRT